MDIGCQIKKLGIKEGKICCSSRVQAAIWHSKLFRGIDHSSPTNVYYTNCPESNCTHIMGPMDYKCQSVHVGLHSVNKSTIIIQVWHADSFISKL